MKKLIVVVLALSGCMISALGAGSGAKTVDLTVCHLVSPANISKPVFAWKMESDREGAAQSAYCIKVYEGCCPETRKLVWDSTSSIFTRGQREELTNTSAALSPKSFAGVDSS